MSLTDVAISGPIRVSASLALAAGAVLFASPCCVPLVPGYLAYLAGVVGGDAPTVEATDTTVRAGRWRVADAALLFVLGFTVVFAAETISVLGLSDALLADEDLLQRLGGIVTIVMGLVFLGLIPGLQRDARIHRVPRGVIAIADATQVGPTTARGILLVLAYCLGLGIPNACSVGRRCLCRCCTCPWCDSNAHWTDFESAASADWATGACYLG